MVPKSPKRIWCCLHNHLSWTHFHLLISRFLSIHLIHLRQHYYFSLFHLDPYHAQRSVEGNFHDTNNINQNFSSEPSQPYFDFSVTRNITTRVGQTAFLHCRVEDLGDKLVRKCYLMSLCVTVPFFSFLLLWSFVNIHLMYDAFLCCLYDSCYCVKIIFSLFPGQWSLSSAR